MKYAICFDFPEGGNPLFAYTVAGAAGWTSEFSEAQLFDSQDEAESFRTLGYGKTAEYGTVVEVPE